MSKQHEIRINVDTATHKLSIYGPYTDKNIIRLFRGKDFFSRKSEPKIWISEKKSVTVTLFI